MSSVSQTHVQDQDATFRLELIEARMSFVLAKVDGLQGMDSMTPIEGQLDVAPLQEKCISKHCGHIKLSGELLLELENAPTCMKSFSVKVQTLGATTETFHPVHEWQGRWRQSRKVLMVSADESNPPYSLGRHIPGGGSGGDMSPARTSCIASSLPSTTTTTTPGSVLPGSFELSGSSNLWMVAMRAKVKEAKAVLERATVVAENVAQSRSATSNDPAAAPILTTPTTTTLSSESPLKAQLEYLELDPLVDGYDDDEGIKRLFEGDEQGLQEFLATKAGFETSVQELMEERLEFDRQRQNLERISVEDTRSLSRVITPP